jgi:glycosyltransferase involved in cell wall biosynthesis
MTAWLANALCETHEVSILSLRMGKEEVFFPLDSRVEHGVLPAFPGKTGMLKQIRWIHHYIKENRIDRVINVDMGMGFYGILAAKRTSARTVTWEHGNFYNNWGSRLFPYMRSFAARHSDAVVVLTKRDQENYRANISRCAPLYVIPNPVQPKNDCYDCDSRMILSVGHLLENKGYHRAIEVAAKVLPQHPEWKWVICGEGPERPRLEEMIREKGLENQVFLPGLVRDMDEMYRKAAMLVMTSEMEGLPMVLLEGKAHRLPLVAFDIMTGPSDIIDHEINGFLVEPFDLDAMADRILRLVEDDALRCRLSEKATVGMEKFAKETIMDTWERVLEEDKWNH